jgi:hypothetical protein
VVNLKKRSQFAPTRIGAKSLVKGDYGNKPACGVEGNKPKQSQSPAFGWKHEALNAKS